MDIMNNFESLGDNCEFGFIQRDHGFEEGGLFKWSRIMQIDDLINVIKNDFGGAYEYQNLKPIDGDMIIDSRYAIRYHTEIKSEMENGEWVCKLTKTETEDIYNREYAKRIHLINKTRDMLRNSRKIFVFKMNDAPSIGKVLQLFETLNHFGNNSLLFVRKADEDNPSGTFVVHDRLYFGYIERFAPYWPATEYARKPWETLCSAVWKKHSNE